MIVRYLNVGVATSLMMGFFNVALAENGSRAFSVPRVGVTILTGDSWEQSGHTVRLYGVEACARGKFYKDQNGILQDCGHVSLAMLAALLRDTNPVCTPIATISLSRPTVLAVCKARIRERTVDIGSMMITRGFAFAATTDQGEPVYLPYFAQQSIARRSRSGLWAFNDVPVPSRGVANIK